MADGLSDGDGQYGGRPEVGNSTYSTETRKFHYHYHMFSLVEFSLTINPDNLDTLPPSLIPSARVFFSLE